MLNVLFLLLFMNPFSLFAMKREWPSTRDQEAIRKEEELFKKLKDELRDLSDEDQLRELEKHSLAVLYIDEYNGGAFIASIPWLNQVHNQQNSDNTPNTANSAKFYWEH